jgi:hypothetical protein
VVLKIIINDGSPLTLWKSARLGVLVVARVLDVQGHVQGCRGILKNLNLLVVGRGALMSILVVLVRQNEVMSSLLLPQHELVLHDVLPLLVPHELLLCVHPIRSSTYKVRMVQMMSWEMMSWDTELVRGVLHLVRELAQRVVLGQVHELGLGYDVQDFFLKQLGFDVQQSLVPPLIHVPEQVHCELPQLRSGVLVLHGGSLLVVVHEWSRVHELSLVHDEWSLVHEIARNVMGYRVVLYVLALANDVLMIFFQNALRQVQNYYVGYPHGYGGPL